MANVLTRPCGRKRILVSTFVVSMQTTSFLLMTKILPVCVAGRRVPLDDKLNKTIIIVLVYADTIKASLYFQLK